MSWTDSDSRLCPCEALAWYMIISSSGSLCRDPQKWSPMSRSRASTERRRVVIIGGGFGGLEAARRLNKGDVDVIVVDRHNHLLFQPLIYQVAAGALSSGEVAAPLRHLLRRQRNATVLMAEVTDVDVERQQVVLDGGERVDYDQLDRRLWRSDLLLRA